MTPKAVATRLRKLLRSDEAYALLDAHPEVSGTTWTSGACWPLAAALVKALPGAKMVAVVPKDSLRAQHVVTAWRGGYLDADGWSTKAQLLKRWREQEMVEFPRLVPFERASVTGGMACPGGLVQKLATLLRGIGGVQRRRRPNPTWNLGGLDVEIQYDPAPGREPWRYWIRLEDEELWDDEGFVTEDEALRAAMEQIRDHIPDTEYLQQGYEPFGEPDEDWYGSTLWFGPGTVTEVAGDCVYEYREMDEPDDEGRWWYRMSACPYPAPLSKRLRASVGVDIIGRWGDSEASYVDDDDVPQPAKNNPRKRPRKPRKRAETHRALFRRLMRL